MSNYDLVKKLILSDSITPLEAMTNLNLKLEVSEIMQLKQYHCDIQNKVVQNKKPVLKYGLIMLVGIPSSGKTTFSNTLCTTFGSTIIHLNQDEIGREACYSLLSQHAKKSDKTIILDRCNLTKTERHDWLTTYSSLSSRPILCISFNLQAEICKARLKCRTNHAMKNPNVIEGLKSKFQMPEVDEGFYSVVEITDDDNLVDIYLLFGIQYINPFSQQIGLKKFVRTKHIANLGGAGRDDLIWSGKELDDFLKHNVIVEEKIDGANLGIFLDEDDQIIIQNRSHYISPDYHPQFATINKWKFKHEHEIRSILTGTKWIIYGEWCVVKHSILYTKLPDSFILFDIYDRTTDTFFSRQKVEEIIADTTLVMIRIVAQGVFSIDQLKKIAYSPSGYYNGYVEGVYVRCFDSNNRLKYRGKIVRHDFITPGTSHWSKTDIIKNIIV